MKRTLLPVLSIAGLLLCSLGNPIGVLLFALVALACLPKQTALYAFPSNCNGRVINVSASNGCTLTRADIQGLTPNDFEAQGFKEIGMDKVYANSREARLAGYRENSLQMLMNSRITNIKGMLTKQAIGGSRSVILPFVSFRQKRNINSNYWLVNSGVPSPGAGMGSKPSSAWDLTIANSPSPLASTLVNVDRYFLPGKYIFLEYADATTQTAYALQYKILDSQPVGAGSTATVTVQPNYTNTGWNALTAAKKLPYQIGGVNGGNAVTGTIAYLGVNAVSDYESWGGQDVAENTNSLLNFFLQTSRIVHEYSDEYVAALDAALTSEYFKQFAQLPLAEQKRIQRAKYDRDMMQAFFFGQAIDENQGVETYRNLPTVVDPANPNCVLEYKSMALGARTLLNNCGRLLDHQGNKLNLDTLLQTLYLVKRAREADGTEVDTIDCMTDRFTAGMIQDVMLSFYKAKYGVVLQRMYEPDQELKFENQVYLKYNKYQIPSELGGFSLAVFTHPYFDDKLAASGATNRGRTLWFLDWTDIMLGVVGTNSAVRRTNEADALYNYVMKINAKHVTLDSMTWCPVIEDPNRHYICENFGPACAQLTVSGCDVQVAP